MAANAFERGARAKRRGKLAESNPFAKRGGRANAKRANDWLLGWHSASVSLGASGGSGGPFEWPPLVEMPAPPEGDYGVRMRGLDALFRPQDPVEWEVLRLEMQQGLVERVPEWAIVGYTILWYYSDGEIGCSPPPGVGSGPMRYLASALRIQRGCSRWPPIVVSAYEELSSK